MIENTKKNNTKTQKHKNKTKQTCNLNMYLFEFLISPNCFTWPFLFWPLSWDSLKKTTHFSELR